MKNTFHRSKRALMSLCLTPVAVCLLAATAQAQIASYMDEHGRVIYVNEDSPQTSGGSSMSRFSRTREAPAVASDLATARLTAAPKAATSGEDFSTSLAKASDTRLDRIVQDAAQRHSLDPALVKAVISTESGWNTRAISQKGAVGLMQLIPATAQRFGVGNPFDPAQNVEGGTMYLKSLLDRYNGDLAKSLAAYNAGERAVDSSGGVPAIRETQNYVQKVTHAYFRPESGRNPVLWSPPKPVVRREIAPDGRVVFTNE
jgi:soluble lytic murein transglycosylase-like protein